MLMILKKVSGFPFINLIIAPSSAVADN